jgi:hypothetical protein
MQPFAFTWNQPQSEIAAMEEVAYVTVSVLNLTTQQDKDAFAHLLSRGLFRVRFVKADKSIRDMLCTRDPDVIEKYMPSSDERLRVMDDRPFAEDAAKARAEKACAVFDLDKKAWRSFKWNSVIGFEKA